MGRALSNLQDGEPVTGKIYDKHGRMKWMEVPSSLSSYICDDCGARVQNLQEHKALFHPIYRQDALDKTPLRIILSRVADPDQQELEKYPDTGETAETYNKEIISIRPAPGTCCPEMDFDKNGICKGCGHDRRQRFLS